MNRKYPGKPIACVGVIIVNRKKVLIIKRAFEPSRGKWSIPGGVVELGETVEDAAKREIREELELEVKIKEVVEVVDSIIYDNDRIKYHFVLIDFWAELQGGTMTLNQECLDAAWISRNNLYSYDLTEGARKVIEKVFKIVDKK